MAPLIRTFSKNMTTTNHNAPNPMAGTESQLSYFAGRSDVSDMLVICDGLDDIATNEQFSADWRKVEVAS